MVQGDQLASIGEHRLHLHLGERFYDGQGRLDVAMHQKRLNCYLYIPALSFHKRSQHRAWIKATKEQGGVGELRYPLASDATHQVSKDYGVYIDDAGHSLRGTFLIDPKGVLRSSVVNDLDVGRNVDETLRTLQAFKTGGLCPIGWQKGQATLKVG